LIGQNPRPQCHVKNIGVDGKIPQGQFIEHAFPYDEEKLGFTTTYLPVPGDLTNLFQQPAARRLKNTRDTQAHWPTRRNVMPRDYIPTESAFTNTLPRQVCYSTYGKPFELLGRWDPYVLLGKDR
jgi:hypothetical protein